MKLTTVFLGNKGAALATAKGRRFQVIWRLYPGSGRGEIEPKRTTFTTKAQAKVFVDYVRYADLGFDGWRFDDAGQPTQEALNAMSVFDALVSYVQSRWATQWSESQRTKVRGRLLEVIALTSGTPDDQRALLAALEHQRLDRGEPAAPTTQAQWATRWLRRHALYPSHAATWSDEEEAARRWLCAQSLAVSALDVKAVTALRLHFSRSGLAYDTARTYWNGAVVPFLKWLYDSGLVARPLLGGQPKVPRDMEGERPDPDLVPEPEIIGQIARHFADAHGDVWGLYPLISTFCALRIGEALDIQLRDFFERNGRLFLRRQTQTIRVVKASSDDGQGKN